MSGNSMYSTKRWAVLAWLLLSGGYASADSLFQPESYQPMVADRKAFRIGDSLTVLIVENASAAASADTSANKEGGSGVKLSAPTYDKAYAVDLTENFKGSGKIQRTGKLLAQITVSVQSVLPNGDLQVKGDQFIEFNNEKQHISIEGKVRPEDIASNNTVLSTRVGDARLSYIGKGILGEKQRPGLISRFLSWLRIL
ncbi:MAG TPA: flagellar basal body L-ring protein FlgH [Acidiferrobacterales bacterium]|nr:flagellar basal body L-ring protein FlgH [Acidiferrobacterales bacterium]